MSKLAAGLWSDSIEALLTTFRDDEGRAR